MEQQQPLKHIHTGISKREMECIWQATISLLEELNGAEASGHPFSNMFKQIMGHMFLSGQAARTKMELKIFEFNAEEMAFLQIAIQMMIEKGKDMTSDPAFMAMQGEKGAQNIRNILALAQSVQQKLNAATGQDFNMPEVTAEDKEWMLAKPE